MPDRPHSSLLVWRTATAAGDTPGAILRLVIDRLRAENRADAAREISLAVTHCEEALHWIEAIEKKRTGGQNGQLG